MAFENRMARDHDLIAIDNPAAGGQAPARNGDVVARRGQTAHIMKGIGIGHESQLLGAARCYAWFQSFEVAHALYLTEISAERK
jgi:hypothetical protein